MTDIALQPYNNRTAIVNVDWPERAASVALGSKIALKGVFELFKYPFKSALRILAGGYLVQRGITGHCDVYTRLGKITTEDSLIPEVYVVETDCDVDDISDDVTVVTITNKDEEEYL